VNITEIKIYCQVSAFLTVLLLSTSQ